MHRELPKKLKEKNWKMERGFKIFLRMKVEKEGMGGRRREKAKKKQI